MSIPQPKCSREGARTCVPLYQSSPERDERSRDSRVAPRSHAPNPHPGHSKCVCTNAHIAGSTTPPASAQNVGAERQIAYSSIAHMPTNTRISPHALISTTLNAPSKRRTHAPHPPTVCGRRSLRPLNATGHPHLASSFPPEQLSHGRCGWPSSTGLKVHPLHPSPPPKRCYLAAFGKRQYEEPGHRFR